MDDAVTTELLPASASADGRRNSYTHSCKVLSQQMNYAACLGRLKALEDKSVRTPQDWDQCRQACRSKDCAAAQMRSEEELQGKAIYFVERGAIASAISTAKSWVTTWGKKPSMRRGEELNAVGGMLNAVDGMKSIEYADAFNVKKAAPPKATVKTVAKAPTLPGVKLVPLPGETPLQMARRLLAQKQQKETT